MTFALKIPNNLFPQPSMYFFLPGDRWALAFKKIKSEEIPVNPFTWAEVKSFKVRKLSPILYDPNTDTVIGGVSSF